MANDYPIETVLDILDKIYPYHPMGTVTEHNPYKVLICCLLSLRSRDVVTVPVCGALFKIADTPEKLLALPPETLASLIAPVRFYRNKLHIIRTVSQALLDRFAGEVPDDVDVLDTLPGVGRKTANLVVELGYGKPAITVDTHVHRICNRLGYVATRTPDETEITLREKLPPRYWLVINRVLVRHGQEICLPGHPRCDLCPVEAYCHKVNVIPRKSRRPVKPVHAVFQQK